MGSEMASGKVKEGAITLRVREDGRGKGSRGVEGEEDECLFFIFLFFFNRWLQRISRILAVLGYEGIKQATPVVLRPKRKSSAHSL